MIKVLIIVVVIYLFMIWTKTREGMNEFKGHRYCHRGYYTKNELPENSIPAFKKAVDNGYGIEFDVHLLADGNLAVIHDSNIERMTGKDVVIEELTTEDLRDCKLDDMEYSIPTFKEVLELVDGKVPLIIELKHHYNAKYLCEALMKQLEGYDGLYCVECFYPEVVAYMRKHYPKVLRGQLTFNYFKDNNHPYPISFALQFLLLNVVARPDFIAYEFSVRKNLSNVILTKLFKVQQVSWTIKSKEDLLTAEKEGSIPIFEGFDPKQ